MNRENFELLKTLVQQLEGKEDFDSASRTFCEILDEKFDLGGVWFARKFSKRWHFIGGRKSRKGLPPVRIDLFPNLALFVEDEEKIGKDRDFLLLLAKLFLYLFPAEQL